MPVVSKLFRERSGPPVLGPRPYQAPRQAWTTTSVQAPVTETHVNGDASDSSKTTSSASDSKQKVPFSILRKSTTGGSGHATSPKTPPTVTFSKENLIADDSNNEYENAPPPIYPRAKKTFASPSSLGGGGVRDNTRASQSLVAPVRPTLGAEAVKECEEHTDWVNEVLSDHNLPLISNLTTSIRDGFTLPIILEIISGVSLNSVQSNPRTAEDRVRNIGNCLSFLAKRGVDTNNIKPADVEDGKLKTILHLVGNIRKHFKTSYRPQCNGGGDVVPVSGYGVLSEREGAHHTMPGTMKLPGGVPTPFLPQRDKHTNRNDSGGRQSAFQEVEMLPGMMGMEKNNNNNMTSEHTKPHSNIISTTEIGMNGVAQHGVDERKTHFANNTTHIPNNSRGNIIRHPNAKGFTSNPQENSSQPPSAAHRAWTDSPNRGHNHMNGVGGGSTVEDRLKQLITSNNRNQQGTNGQQKSVAYPLHGGGYFHCGGSEVFDLDGEVLNIPPRQTRQSPVEVEDGVFAENAYGPGYRVPGSQPDRQKQPQGYVPSKPGEKRQGSRADVIISRPPSAVAFRQRQPAPQVASYINRARPSSAAGNLTGGAYVGGGHDNGGFMQDFGPGSSQVNRAGAPGSVKVGSNDLRSAWNKLYGPPGQTASPYVSPKMSRADNLRASYGPNNQQPLGQNGKMNNGDRFQGQSSGPPGMNRPVSAPAPAHMHAYFSSHERLQGPGHSQSQDELEDQIDSQGQGHSRGHSLHGSQEHSQYKQSQGHNNHQGQMPYGSHGDNDHFGNNHTQRHLGQGHSYNTSSNQRESPMGQSSSTQGQLDDSTSSQQSRLSQDMLQKNLHIQTSGDNSRKLSQSSPSSLSQPSPNSPGSPNYAIGPASKYPDNPSSRPTSARKDMSKPPALPARSPQVPRPSLPKRNTVIVHNERSSDRKPHNVSFPGDFSAADNNVSNVSVHKNLSSGVHSKDLTTALQAASREHQLRYDTSHDLSHNQSHDLSQDFQSRSIFDYQDHSESTGSVTPPLPPLSPTNTPPDSPRMEASGNLPRSISATNVSSGDMALNVEEKGQARDSRKPRRTSELNFKMAPRPHGKKTRRSGRKGNHLLDVRESDSDLSFDIDDTILTVESHDVEQPHPAGDILTSQETTDLRQQLHNLEYRYHDLQGRATGKGPPPIGRQRRWSIGSSDTSSFRREAKFKPSKQPHHKHHSKEFKNINKRFQRLESHVVTLARSVAHLTSELRNHNTMVNDLETVKRHLQEVRDNPGSRSFPNMLGSCLMDGQRSRDWVPGLINPKRVNKLTKFFGEEPPLLDFFLKKLGYERYVSNFQLEHIGMIELPYMTEDRLEKIGVPMGPRLRILQEAQQCFRHENYDVYMV